MAGTLLPKKGKPILVLPDSIIGIVTVSTNEKIKPTTGFIFTKPVVQGQTNLPKNNSSNSSSNQTPFNNTTSSYTINSKKSTVQLSSTPGQIIPVDTLNLTYESPQGPLKYEEPPANSNTSATKTDSVIEYVSSLIYGPPPSTSVSNLRSPKILGLYKPSLNEPILLVPIALEDIEGNQL